MSVRTERQLWICIRAVTAFLAGVVLYMIFPSWCLKVLATPAGWITEATCFYLESVRISVDQMHLRIQGIIHLPAVLMDGTIMPPLPAEWAKQGGQTIMILVMAMAVFAAPSVSTKRRLALLPVMLLFAGTISAVELSVDIQHASLKGLLGDALSAFTFKADPINEQLNTRLVRRYEIMDAIKIFNDGGGRLFLGAIAGLAPYLLMGKTTHPDAM